MFVTDFHLDWQAVKKNQYENDPLLLACGVSVEKQFMQIAGRVLEPPKVDGACFITKGLCKLFDFSKNHWRHIYQHFSVHSMQLKVGRGQDCLPDDGRWTFKNKVSLTIDAHFYCLP